MARTSSDSRHRSIEQRTRRPHADGGFTLVELVAIIVLLAILAGVAAPSIASVAGTRQVAATRQLQRDLTFARKYALATGATTWVVFEPAADRWRFLREDPAAPGRAGAVPLPATGTGGELLRQINDGAFAGVGLSGVSIGGGVEIGFDWRGRPEDGSETPLAAPAQITIDGGSGVVVQPGTGNVTTFGL